MQRFKRVLAAVIHAPLLQGAVALSLFYVGISESIEERSLSRYDGEDGLLLLGLVLFVRSATAIFQGAGILGHLLVKRAVSARPSLLTRIGQITEHHLFESVLGVLLLVAGICEALEPILKRTEQFEAWSLGLMFIGLSFSLRSLSALYRSFSLLLKGTQNSTGIRHWLSRIDHLIRQPRVEVATGLLLIGFGLIDKYFVGNESGLDEHEGIMIMGTMNVIKVFQNAFESIELVEHGLDTAERKLENEFEKGLEFVDEEVKALVGELGQKGEETQVTP